MTFRFSALAVQATWFLAFACQAEPGPRLLPASGSTVEALASSECSDALSFARWAFFAPEFVPDTPSGNPLALKSLLTLMPEPIDACIQSGSGAGNTRGTSQMPRLEYDGRFRYQFADIESAAFIHVKPMAGHWLSLGSDWLNTDPVYLVFLLPEQPTLAQVRDMTKSVVWGGQSETPTPVAQSRLPPRFYERRDGTRPWLLVRQDGLYGQAGPLAPWTVLTIGADGLKERCTVAFLPPTEDPLAALPAATRRLRELLDATMGSGKDEGTYHATDRLRSYARSVWINILLRPWVIAQPYNSRKAVDRHLSDWAAHGPENRRTTIAIRRQLPLAEAALANHYQRRFGLSKDEAKRVATFQLDIGLRSHFKFSEKNAADAAEKIINNPWPARAFPDRIYSLLEPSCGPRKSPLSAD